MTALYTDQPAINAGRYARDPKLLAYIEQKAEDAHHERRKHESQWRENGKLTLGAHKEVFGAGSKREYVTADRINNSVVLQWAVATERSPRIAFRPRETNEPPTWFVKPEGAEKLAQFGPGIGLTPGQVQGIEAIDDALVQRLLQVKVPRPAQQEMPGPDGEPTVQVVMQQVPLLDPEADFIAVTDELAAEALTQELASEWSMAGCDELMSRHVFENIVYGSRQVMFQWDAEQNRGEMVDLYPFKVWIDPWSTTNYDGEYVNVLQVLPIREAIAEYSDIPEAEMRRMAKSGSAAYSPFASEIRGGKYENMGDREAVHRWTYFERHARFDLSEDEAVAQGLVEQAVEEVPLTATDPETGESFETGEVAEQPIVDEAGEPQWILAETGEATSPGLPSWPKRTGIRHVEMIGDYVLYDGECIYSDIPVGRNTNIPIPDSPYGQGTPQRLAPLQEFYNRLMSLLREHAQYFAQPQKVMPQSAMEQMQSEVSELHALASKNIGVPDDLIYAFGSIQNVIQTLDPPALQEAFISLLSQIGDLMDRVSGTTDVLRGEAKSEWSGETVGKLQTAARGPIGVMARATAFLLTYVGKMWANAIIDYLPLDVWAQRNSKYPPQVLEAMRQRLKRVGYDVEPEVANAGPRDVKFQRLTQLISTVPDVLKTPTFARQYFEVAEIAGAEQIAKELVQIQQAPPPMPA